jgi:hypothetical protein
MGSGSPIINKNNHPFVSSDKSIGLIHNGIIKDFEYSALKKKYSVTSQCDSEMFLRVFEHEREQSNSLEGIKKIWSYMSRSHMALAIGEWLPNGERCLWLLRNKHRSIWLADLRSLLGQIFFFSTPDIWDEAASNCKIAAGHYLKRVKQIEIQEEEVWKFNIDSKNSVPLNDTLEKFTLNKGEYKNWVFDGNIVPVIKKEPITKILTKLDQQEEPLDPIKNKLITKLAVSGRTFLHEIPQKQDDLLFPDASNKGKSINSLNKLCEDIRKIVDDIEITTENLIEDESIDNANLGELLSSLEQTKWDLEGTGRIIENLH